MIYLLTTIVVIGALLLVGYGVFTVVQSKTSSEIRASKQKDIEIKALRTKVANRDTRLLMATDSLNKITADYTHNPSLEARICLDDIRAHEIKEINDSN